jgi:hypothetical protein
MHLPFVFEMRTGLHSNTSVGEEQVSARSGGGASNTIMGKLAEVFAFDLSKSLMDGGKAR